MVIPVFTNYGQMCLMVKLQTSSPQKLRIIFKDAEKENTIFTDRFKTVNGTLPIYINCPITGKYGELIVYNEDIGNIPSKGDSTFNILEINPLPLEKRVDIVDFTDPALKSAINFFTKFSYNAGFLNTGTYHSTDRRYYIEYLSQIISSEPPYLPLNTSSRVDKYKGTIQASQDKFQLMTVPARMVTLLHEYSHYFVNKNIEDETEADLNGLVIYLSLGFPRVDAIHEFTSAFYGAANELNKQRIDTIVKFINDFDKSHIFVYK